MSITIINSPSGKPSIQDDLWHIAASSNSGVTDFKYVFDVFVNGVQKVRTKVFPDPNTGRGYFNASQIVKNSITYDWAVFKDDVLCAYPSASGEVSLAYDVRYGEDISGVTTLNMASGTTRGYNWRPPIFQRRVKTISDKDNTWVTSRPLYANVARPTIVSGDYVGEKLMIGFNRTDDLTLVVDTYGYGNNFIGTQNIGTVPGSPSDYFQLNISPAAINNFYGSALINDNVKYYDIYLNGADDLFRVNIICDRGYTPIPLHFMNMWVLFDTARFGLVSRLNMEVERKAFTQRDYDLGASSVDYFNSENKYRESKLNYGQRGNFTYQLTMDAPTDDDYNWLYELLLSPQVYAEIEGYYYPVTVKTTAYEFSKLINNRLRAFEIEIEVNQTRYSHGR